MDSGFGGHGYQPWEEVGVLLGEKARGRAMSTLAHSLVRRRNALRHSNSRLLNIAGRLMHVVPRSQRALACETANIRSQRSINVVDLTSHFARLNVTILISMKSYGLLLHMMAETIRQYNPNH